MSEIVKGLRVEESEIKGTFKILEIVEDVPAPRLQIGEKIKIGNDSFIIKHISSDQFRAEKIKDAPGKNQRSRHASKPKP